MKPVGLFVLPFYQIGGYFTSGSTASKPIQNRHKRYSFGTLYRHLGTTWRSVPFGFGMVGERLCLSKALGNFDCVENFFLQQNSRASLAGRPLTDCALLSRFGCAERQKRRTETISLPLGFYIGTLGNGWETLCFPCLFIPAVKAYNVSKKFQEEYCQ